MATTSTDLDQNWTQIANTSNGTSMISTNQSFTYLMIKASMIPVILMSNILIIGAVIFSAPLRKKPSYILVSSLATADFAVGAVVLPYDLLYDLEPGLNNLESGCVIKICMWVCGLGLSITHLFAIALERLLATQFPFIYITSYTKSRSVTVVVCVWTICVGLGSGAFFLQREWNAEYHCYMRAMLSHAYGRILTIYQVTLTLSTFFIYFRVFCVIRKNRKMRREMTSASVVVEGRRSIASFLVFLLFVAFWAPASINGMVSRILGVTDASLAKPLALLATANSFVNFIVYSLMNREIRMVWRKMLPCGQAPSETRGIQARVEAPPPCCIPPETGVPTVCGSSTSAGKAESTTSTSVSMVNLGETGTVK